MNFNELMEISLLLLFSSFNLLKKIVEFGAIFMLILTLIGAQGRRSQIIIIKKIIEKKKIYFFLI